MIENEEGRAAPAKLSGASDADGATPAGDGAGRTAEPASLMSGADFQRYIGRQLRAVYDDVAKQPVPDRFLELMKKLG